MVLGATVVNRWFVARRGTVMGLLAASTATGSLFFLPALAALAHDHGWRAPVLAVTIGCLVLVPLVALFLPEHPERLGLLPHGAPPDYVPPPPPDRHPLRMAVGALRDAAVKRDFWFLFLTFFVCGFTTNGLIGYAFHRHLCRSWDRRGAGGGLSGHDGVVRPVRHHPVRLADRPDGCALAAVFLLRAAGVSLVALPFCDFSPASLTVFGIFYGLDWIATVPPTLRLATSAFGERAAPVVFGWVVFGHQIGAACAASLAGLLRQAQGNYRDMLVLAAARGCWRR
jgi:MFS family permease